MKRFTRLGWIVLPVAAASVALAVAGCGGGSGGGASASGGSAYGESTTTATKPGATTSATLAVGKTSLGKILVGANGRSLYMFEKDKTPTSTCNGACAAAWTPFTTTGKPKAATGVDSAKLTTSKRADGKAQVVYAGDPLYYYAPDTQAGQTTGQNLDQFGAEWYVVSPAGQKVEGGSS
jgi:predicted lipoprotein with Yx(FWY)xxD motif